MSLKRLTCERARSISIVETLAKLGYFPSRKTEKEAWFLSPLRSETQASFKVSFKLNRWYDFGIGKGGNVIDLVLAYSRCSIPEALQFLSDEIPVFHYQGSYSDLAPKEQGNIIRKVQPITKSYLKKYVRSRGIPLQTAKRFCKEVWYECHGKIYYAIGLENKDGGWELRNLYVKTCSSPKTYTYLKNNATQLLVCEGMFDLLSIAELYPKTLEQSDSIILNSLSFLEPVTALFKSYQSVHLYLDNDAAGRRNTQQLVKLYPQVIDQRNQYKNYKDLNEKLVSEISLDKT